MSKPIVNKNFENHQGVLVVKQNLSIEWNFDFCNTGVSVIQNL